MVSYRADEVKEESRVDRKLKTAVFIVGDTKYTGGTVMGCNLWSTPNVPGCRLGASTYYPVQLWEDFNPGVFSKSFYLNMFNVGFFNSVIPVLNPRSIPPSAISGSPGKDVSFPPTIIAEIRNNYSVSSR